VPDARSEAAAARLGDAVARVAPGDEVWVLLSGGASSLAAAPVDGVGGGDLAALSRLLLGSGLDIAAMNAVRKRFARWGGGRLAAALAARGAGRVRCLVVSDVIGDDLAAIGSGPCVPDPVTAAELRTRLADAALWEALPGALRAAIEAASATRASRRRRPATRVRTGRDGARRQQPALARRDGRARVGARHRGARRERRARGRGAHRGTHPRRRDARPRRLPARGRHPLPRVGRRDHGHARRVARPGRAGARSSPSRRRRRSRSPPWAGGGAAAFLAAGTDGRDGPTDAAGAVVDARTWTAVGAAGRDPRRDLDAHDAYAALDAAGALVRPGLTGTNVMDVMVGLVP
jgi:hydroxypyruvate reductase